MIIRLWTTLGDCVRGRHRDHGHMVILLVILDRVLDGVEVELLDAGTLEGFSSIL